MKKISRKYNECITPEKNKIVKNPLWWKKLRKGITSIGTGIVGSRLLALLLHIIVTPIGVSMWFIRNIKNAISVDIKNHKNNARPVFASAPYALAIALLTVGSIKLYSMNPKAYIDELIDSTKSKITEKVIEKTVPIVPTTRTKSFGKEVTNTVENMKDTVKDNVIWIGENLVTNPVVTTAEPEPEVSPEVSEEIVEEVIEEPATTVEEVEETVDIGPAPIDSQISDDANTQAEAEASEEEVEKNPEGATETPDVRRSFVQ